jgi:hypothetical protein
MQPLQTFNVSPRLPENLEPLRELAHNLWWTWEPDARRLFRHLDVQLWDRTNHNPIRMLQLSRQARLIELANDDDYIREMQAVYQKFRLIWPAQIPTANYGPPLHASPTSLLNSGSTNPYRTTPVV